MINIILRTSIFFTQHRIAEIPTPKYQLLLPILRQNFKQFFKAVSSFQVA